MQLLLAIYLPVAIAYGDTFVWIWDRWMLGDYYSHGPLLPFVAAAALYFRKEEWAASPAHVDLRGWWFLGAGLLLRLVGAAQMVDSISAMSLIPTLIGVVYITVGPARLRRLLPVILLLAFATPMPIDLTGHVAFELKEIAVDAAMWMGNALGLDATRVGASVRVPGQAEVLPVADACGGLRSLLALTTLGYCLAFFMGTPSAWRRTVLLVVTVPLAVGVNVFRIVGLCFLAKHVDVRFAGGTGHTMMNIAAWVLNIAVLLGLDVLLERRLARAGPAAAGGGRG